MFAVLRCSSVLGRQLGELPGLKRRTALSRSAACSSISVFPMLGPPKRRCLDQPTRISLEDLVPTNHFYRHLDATLDLSLVRDWVAD
jgi:hypothetical protein